MDPFGTALIAYQNGDTEASVTIRRDDGHADHHGVALYFEAEPFAHERKVLADVRGPVLDVGCGAGRHVRWLRQHGIDAMGVDVSPGAVAVCTARGVDARLGDVMEMDPPEWRGAFGAVTFFGNNVGVAGTFDRAIDLFKRCHRWTTPNGMLLLTGLNIAKTDAQVHLDYHASNLAQGRRRGEIVMMMAFQGLQGDPTSWFHPEPDEVEEIGRASGWGTVNLIDRDALFFGAVLRKAKI